VDQRRRPQHHRRDDRLPARPGLALATLTSVAGMIPGAGEAIFAVARTAGWIAHALEEYAKNAPLRPRTVYTGPHPISPEAPVVPGPRPVPQPSAAASRE
jgi:hypothetical protein